MNGLRWILIDDYCWFYDGWVISEETAVARAFRDVHLLSIGGPTSEIMKEISSKAVRFWMRAVLLAVVLASTPAFAQKGAVEGDRPGMAAQPEAAEPDRAGATTEVNSEQATDPDAAPWPEAAQRVEAEEGSAAAASAGPNDPLRAHRLIFGSLGSAGGALVGAFGGMMVGLVVALATACSGWCGLGFAALGAYGGGVVGLPLGGYLVARQFDGRGSFLATMAGAGVGLLASFVAGYAAVTLSGLATSGNYPLYSGASLALGIIAAASPFIGSAIGFDFSDQSARRKEADAQVRVGLGSVLIVFR